MPQLNPSCAPLYLFSLFFGRWADTWGPEGDADDSCDATADTEDQDQDGGCMNQPSPGNDDKGEDPGAPQELDAAAQNARLRSKQDAQPNTCVYVGFLGWWVTEKDLQDYFSPYGQLASVRVSGWGRMLMLMVEQDAWARWV